MKDVRYKCDCCGNYHIGQEYTIKDHLQAIKDYVDSLDTTKLNCCSDCIIRRLCEAMFNECPAFWDLSEIED